MFDCVISTGTRSNILSHCEVLSVDWRSIDNFEILKNKRILLLNFGAPTKDAQNYAKACTGIYEQMDFIRNLLKVASSLCILHVRSCAELEIRVENGSRHYLGWKALTLSNRLLIDLPYAYWKLYQAVELDVLASENSDKLKLYSLLVPFVDFEDGPSNSNYYMPNQFPIFDLKSVFTVIKISTIKKIIEYLAKEHIYNSPSYSLASISSLCVLEKTVDDNIATRIKYLIFSLALSIPLIERVRLRRIADSITKPGKILFK